MPEPVALTVSDAIELFLESVLRSRSENTARTYQNGMNLFKEILTRKNLNPDTTPVVRLPEDSVGWFAAYLKNSAPTTERVYLTAASRLFEYIAAENLTSVNLPRIKLLIQQRARKPGQRLPQFPRDAIEKVLEYVKYITTTPYEDENDHLRRLRDHAFLVTLADTGLRVHEACGFAAATLIFSRAGQSLLVKATGRLWSVFRSVLCRRSENIWRTGRNLTGHQAKRSAPCPCSPVTTTEPVRKSSPSRPQQAGILLP